MRWEYKRSRVPVNDVAEAGFEDQLNALGGDGWELISAIQRADRGYSHEVYLVFRRPLPRVAAVVAR